MPQRHVTVKTDKGRPIPVDKKAGKAREEELVKLVTDSCNEKFNAGYAANPMASAMMDPSRYIMIHFPKQT